MILVPPGVLEQTLGGGGGGFLTEEYIIYKDAATSAYLYKYVDLDGGSISDVDSMGTISGASEAIATDGQFIFIQTGNWDGSAYRLYQYAYDGANFSLVHQAGPSGQFDTAAGALYLPSNPGYLVEGAGGSGLFVFSYQTAPTYAWGTPNPKTEASDDWISAKDIRFSAPGEPGIGDSLVTVPNTSSNQYVNSYSVSGTTWTKYGGNVSCGSYPYSAAMGVDRDFGGISLVNGSSANVLLLQYSMSTRQISSVGTSSSTGTAVACTTWSGGYLICQLTNGTVKSYAVSGTTLTEKDSIAYGGGASTNNQMLTSPYTNHVYVTANGWLRVLRVNPDGTLDEIAAHASQPTNSSGSCDKIAFLDAALVVT